MKVTVEVPTVPYSGGRPTQRDYRTAAANLRGRYSPGGSNVRATVAALLDRVAAAIDEAEQHPAAEPHPPLDALRLAPDGRSVTEELTYPERQALPPVYHQPVWYDLATPAAWICSVCWDEGRTDGWPCTVASRDGGPIADYAGLDATR
jgi:hypothetical protein